MSILNDNPQQRAPKPGKLKWLPEEVRGLKNNAVLPRGLPPSARSPADPCSSRPFSPLSSRFLHTSGGTPNSRTQTPPPVARNVCRAIRASAGPCKMSTAAASRIPPAPTKLVRSYWSLSPGRQAPRRREPAQRQELEADRRVPPRPHRRAVPPPVAKGARPEDRQRGMDGGRKL